MGRMQLDKVDYVNITFIFLLSPSFPLLAPHPTPSSYDLDFASVITPDLTLRRSDTDWTWTLRLSSRWSTRLCVIDLIFLGSRNNSTSCFLLLPWPHLALLLSQERLHSHWSWPTCFPLWPAHQPQYVIIFYYHFSSDSFIFLQLSVELFLVAISHPSYVLTTSCLTTLGTTMDKNHRWWINSHGYGWYPWIIHGIHKNSKSVFYLKNVIFCTISM